MIMVLFFEYKNFFVWYTITMKQVIVLHDAFLKPTDIWYQSVETILPKGYTLITPELPEGNLQGAEFWIPALEKYREQFTPETIVITHGISSLLLLKFLETLSVSIKLYVSVAGTAQTPDHKGYVPIAKTFLETPVLTEQVIAHTKKVIHIWNTADPFIDPSFSIFFAEKIPGLNFPLNGTDHFVNESEPALFQILQKEFNQITQEIIEQEKIQIEQQKQVDREHIVATSLSATTTYDTALAKSIAGYQGRVISELLAEAKVNEDLKKQASIKNPKNIGFIIGTILFIIFGLGLLVYGLRPMIDRVAPNFINRPIYNTFMKVEHESIIRVRENSDIVTELKELQQKFFEQKVFHAILPVRNNEFLLLNDAMKLFSVTIPSGLSGKTDNWIYGTFTLSENTTPAPFLALIINDPETVTLFMKNWEKTILPDTKDLFSFYYESMENITETTPEQLLSESTENIPREEDVIVLNPVEIIENIPIEIVEDNEQVVTIEEPVLESNIVSNIPEETVFTQIVRNNVPVRFGTKDGQELYYGFITRNILVITPEPDILQPLIRRIIER